MGFMHKHFLDSNYFVSIASGFFFGGGDLLSGTKFYLRRVQKECEKITPRGRNPNRVGERDK